MTPQDDNNIIEIEDVIRPSQENNNIIEIEDDDTPSQEGSSIIVHEIQYPGQSTTHYTESKNEEIVGRIGSNCVRRRNLLTLRPRT